MAPQSSAISSAPPSRRSKVNRNRLALIDPSSIRRSPRLTPVTRIGGSVGILSESGGMLSADLCGGSVKRLSVECRLIAENSERIDGGGIGKEIGGGRVKRLSIEQRLIAENMERNGGGEFGKEIKEFGGSGRAKRLSTEQRLIADNLERNGGGGRVTRLSTKQRFIAENLERNGGGGIGKEFGGGCGRVKRLSTEQRLIAENLERNDGGGIGKKFGGGGGRVKRLSTEQRLIAENLQRNAGGVGKDLGGGGRVKMLSTEQRLIAENLERNAGGGRVTRLSTEQRLIAENLERNGGVGTVKRLTSEHRLIAKNLERIGGGGIGKEISCGRRKSCRKRSWTCTDLIDPNSIRRSTRLHGNSGNDFDASKKIEFLSLEDGRSNRRLSKSGGGGMKSMPVEQEDPLRIFVSDSAEISLEGGRRKKMRIECSVASSPKAKGKRGGTVSFFIGDPVSEEEAKKRWPWRFEKILCDSSGSRLSTKQIILCNSLFFIFSSCITDE